MCYIFQTKEIQLMNVKNRIIETKEQFEARCINNGRCPKCLEKLTEEVSPCQVEYSLICKHCNIEVDHGYI